MTTQKIAIGLVAIALFVGSMTAHAANLDAGVEAHNRGDYTTALRIMRELADQGNSDAQYTLGLMYDIGLGVTQEYASALEWYQKAADQGHADAQFNLGVMYQLHNGVTQDYVQAHMWYSLAAAQGKEAASKIRDNLAKQMTPAQIAEAQKLAREWKPEGK